MVDDANGLADSIAVAKREHRDHEPTCEVDLVVERTARASRPMPRATSRAAERGRACVGGVVEDIVEDVRRHEVDPARRLQRVERRQHDGTIAVVERRCDHVDTVLGRRIAAARTSGGRLGARRGRAPRRAGAPPRRRAAAPPRRAAREARLVEGCDDPTDDLGLVASAGTTASSAAARTVGSRSSRRSDEHADVSTGDVRARAEERRDRPALGGRRPSGPDRSTTPRPPRPRLRPRRAASCTSARMRTSGSACSAIWRSATSEAGRRDAGEQIEAEPHVTGVVGPEQRSHGPASSSATSSSSGDE